MLMKKSSLISCALFPFILNAAAPKPYEPSTQSIVDALWNKASHELSASIFYQQAFGDEITFLDATFLGYYSTARYNGLKAAAGMLLAAPILDFSHGHGETYNDVKQIFLFNTAYVDYLDNKLGLHAIAGRYKANSEWNTYYSQGFQVGYSALPYTTLEFLASYGSAMVTNEYVTPFRTDLSSFGTYLLSADFELPKHIHLQPYLYFTGFFTTFGVKAAMSYYITHDIKMETKLHVAGYNKYYPHTFPANVNHKFELAAHAGSTNQDMAGIAWLEQKVKYLDLVEAKVGLIGVTPSGAELIDYYGQLTPFKYTVGMFWAGAITTYGSVGFHWDNLFEIKASVRGSFLPTGSVTSFEIKGESEFPIWRQRNRYGQLKTYMKGKVGLNLTGVYNNTPAINFYGGNQYTIIRGYFRISI